MTYCNVKNIDKKYNIIYADNDFFILIWYNDMEV